MGALSAFDDSFLRARGFDKSGSRTGGIVAPVQVTVPPGAVLVRTFGGDAQRVGQWWFTVRELMKLLDYVGHADVGEGRQAGKGILHAFLAVLRMEWKSTCEFFVVAEVIRPLYAFFGEGDHVLSGATGGRKAAVMNSGGAQHYVRQLFLPKISEYQSAISLRVPFGRVDLELVPTCQQLQARPLPFEV
jgi:hypothetical protein